MSEPADREEIVTPDDSIKVKVRFEQLVEMTATIEVEEGRYNAWLRTAEPTDLTLAEFLRSWRDQEALERNLMRMNQVEGGTQDVIEFTITNAVKVKP